MSMGAGLPAMEWRGLALAAAVLLAATACSGGEPSGPSGGESAVKLVANKAELARELKAAGEKLVLVDLYADWCGPCKMLAPLLEEIARERAATVTVLKVNTDHNPDIAREYGVSGIPLVVFVKRAERVHAVMGVRPKASYERDIERFAPTAVTQAGGGTAPAGSPPPARSETPDGELVDGVRVIRIGPATMPGSLYVHRGETVRLVFEATGQPFGISIPQYEIAESTPAGAELQVTFKAQDVGTFPMFCNGRCPGGEGERLGTIVVIPLESSATARFTELATDEARRMIAEGAVLVDVRTPNEFYEGHIEGARLIPLSQLEGRAGELAAHRDKPVILYCRSGNRSTVAAEILMRKGFKDLYNLRLGIQDWVRRGYPVAS